ncbi:MAG TPA: electron transport complex subunit RsxA [Clostridia bacterium]|jgi:electron transport complex protein RnfA|nr:electron transport complex subunit RsxA [Clostridia bacterium]
MRQIIFVIMGTILVENFVLQKFLGVCPFLGVSKKMDSAVGMSGAVVFVMTLASAVTWAVNEYLLVPNELTFLQTIAFILVVAALVQFVEIILKRFIKPLYKSLGIYLPLITTNCAVLGVALLNIQRSYGFGMSVLYGFSAGLSFTVALILFSGIRERLETADVPEAFKGLPIALISAAFLSLAFMGFQGLFAF